MAGAGADALPACVVLDAELRPTAIGEGGGVAADPSDRAAIGVADRDDFSRRQRGDAAEQRFDAGIVERRGDVIRLALRIFRLIAPAAGEVVDSAQKTHRRNGRAARRLRRIRQDAQFTPQFGNRTCRLAGGM